MARMTGRERLALTVCAAIVVLTAGYYLGYKRYVRYCEDLAGEIAEERDTLRAYRRLLARAENIQTRRAALEAALEKSQDLYLPQAPMGVAQSNLLQRMTALSPELDLSTSGGATRRRGEDRVSVRLQGKGTYPDLVRFLRKVEEFRPLLGIDTFTFSARSNTRRRGRDEPEKPEEPEISMSVTLYALMKPE